MKYRKLGNTGLIVSEVGEPGDQGGENAEAANACTNGMWLSKSVCERNSGIIQSPQGVA